MEPEDKQVAGVLSCEAAHELEQAANLFEHCLDQLSDEEIWQRPTESMNAIGNLVLHVCGNLRQWVLSGVGGAEDVRDRPKEFAERGPIPKDELIQLLDETVSETQQVLSSVLAKELMTTRRIQGREVTGVGAIFHSVSHFRGHTQEIICLTRTQLGDAYKFRWTPSTPEEGAPKKM